MRRILIRTLTVSAVVLCAYGAALAQYPYDHSRGDSDDYYRRDRGYRGGDYYRGNDVGALVDKLQYDLQRAARDAYFSRHGGDRRRLQHAQDKIYDFQTRWNRGNYDRGRLDSLIGSVQSVVDHSPGNWRDRNALMDDLARLRDFRAWNNNNGYRGGYDPYGSRGGYDPYGYPR